MNPIKVVDGLISKRDLAQLYLLMLNIFREALPVNKYLWNGSEESGTTILFYDLVGNITIFLEFTPAAVASVGGRWTPQLGKLFEESPLPYCTEESRISLTLPPHSIAVLQLHI